jgi:hypothetical protein
MKGIACGLVLAGIMLSRQPVLASGLEQGNSVVTMPLRTLICPDSDDH